MLQATNSTEKQDQASKTFSSSLLYLSKDSLHNETKPYKLSYDPGDALPRSNTTNEARQVSVQDMREVLDQISFNHNGFAVINMESKLRPEDFDDPDTVQRVYYREIQAVLLQRFGAKRVEIMEHLVRKRHPEFPRSTGEDYEYSQPTSVAHVDYTLSSALEASRILKSIDASDFDRFQCVNVWKPLWGPLNDWPLAVCDAATVDAADLIASDVVTRTGFTENSLVYFNPNHKWFYLDKQMPSELIVFRQVDTQADSQIGVPHTGIENPHRNPQDRPRESIETRAFVYY